MVPPELQALRTAIDEVDEGLVKLLGRRFHLTREVGRVKARSALQPVDPHREASQRARYRALAAQHQVDPDLVLAVFRAVIDEVVNEHRSA